VVRLGRPGPEAIAANLSRRDIGFSYPEVGASRDLSQSLRDRVSERYDVDQRRFELGHGRELYDRARDALLRWRHFDVPWVEFHGAVEPASVGQVVATLTRVLGVWFLNPCRVVYVDALPEADRVCFAYGTLASHQEAGEERFVVSYDAETDAVWYEIAAFSRPRGWLPWLAYPLARRIQSHFAHATAEALRSALAEGPRTAG